MIFEDAHWVDPTSLEVFGRTVDQIKLFLCCSSLLSARNLTRLDWTAACNKLTLNRLGEREINRN